MTQGDDPVDLEEIEIDLFIEAMLRRYGYDFRDYGRASLTRRVLNLTRKFGVSNVSELTAQVLHAPQRLEDVISGLSVPVSEFFRDPLTFRALKTQVFPFLASFPQITIWQAGCAQGEEVYSLAIMLAEAGLYPRCRIFATDMSEHSLTQARKGIVPLGDIRQASSRYLESGGSGSLSQYFHARYDLAKLDEKLIENVTFAQHNLATDGVFCEAHLVLCRNVMIYFNDRLQSRALQLFADTLVRSGFLCIGDRENLHVHATMPFEQTDMTLPIYRRRRAVDAP